MSVGEQRDNNNQQPFVEVTITNLIIKMHILYRNLMKEIPA